MTPRLAATVSMMAMALGAGCDLDPKAADGRATWSGRWSGVTVDSELTCGVTGSGELRCWGSGARKVALPRTGVERLVASGSDGIVVLESGGSIGCAAANGRCAALPPGRYVDVASGNAGVCAIDSAFALHCGKDRIMPTMTFRRVALGEGTFGCAIRTDGTLACWGGHCEGAGACMGDVKPPPGRYVDIAVARDFACAVSVDGGVVCWSDVPAPDIAPPANLKVTRIAVAGGFSCRREESRHVCAVEVGGRLRCWGRAEPFEWYGTPYGAPSGTFTDVAIAGSHGCARSTAGELSCWGVDQQGQVTGQRAVSNN
jgi:hypothetical protein